MTSTGVDRLAAALEVTVPLVAAVREEQWSAATPCSEWSVHDLVNHVVAGNLMFATALRGGQLPPPGSAGPWAGDQLGAQPVAAFRDSADAVVTAFAQPGVMERPVTVPFGTVPGVVALHLRLTEILVHGWDLARATGQTVTFPEDLVEQELDFTRGKLADVPSNRSPFAPSQAVADDAPALDRLAACLGRSVATA